MDAGRPRRPKASPSETPEAPPVLEAAAADHRQQLMLRRHKGEGGPRKRLPTYCPSQRLISLFSCHCSAASHLLQEEMLMGGGQSGRNAAWPLGGQPRFMELDFYRLGRGPRQELWSPI